MKKQIRTYSNNESLVQKRRVQIVASAIHVFFKNGYKGTTTRLLAKSVGMSEGNLYRYIGSKEDILHLICEMSGQTEINKLKKIARDLSRSGAKHAEILAKCIQHYFKRDDILQEKHIFFSREINQFPLEGKNMLLESQTDHVHFFEKLILEGIESGEFKTVESPLLIAHNIAIIGFDWGLRRWFLKKHFTIEEYTRINTELILNVLNKKDSELKLKGNAETKNSFTGKED